MGTDGTERNRSLSVALGYYVTRSRRNRSVAGTEGASFGDGF